MPADEPLPETLASPSGPPPRLRPQPPPATTLLPTGRVFDDAVRDLLHQRLRFCARVGFGMAAALLVVATTSDSGTAPGAAFGLMANVFFCTVAGAGLLLLRGRPSTARLRGVEVALFGGMTLLGGVLRFAGYQQLPPESPDPRHPGVVVEYATAMANLPVYFVIFFYGLLIPPTRTRCAVMVAVMGVVPLVATALAAVTNPALRPHMPFLLAVTAVGVTTAGAGAVFGAARINSLQREAFEARREAQQLGAYTLRKPLGKGGMGEVWLAEHRLLKRPCAVKFIRADLAANPATAARFAREVRAVITLSHFNTIRIYDYGQSDDGSFYYVMEYLEGPTLESLVGRVGPLEPGRAVYLLRQLCGALAEAHAAGLVHRDLKPGNVIVAALGGQRDVAKLLDFGLVQDLSTADSGERLTQAGVVMGTPAYMCPEQAAGSSAVDARGDVYSLGAVAFFALTRRPPFVCTTVGEHITAHLTQP